MEQVRGIKTATALSAPAADTLPRGMARGVTLAFRSSLVSGARWHFGPRAPPRLGWAGTLGFVARGLLLHLTLSLALFREAYAVGGYFCPDPPLLSQEGSTVSPASKQFQPGPLFIPGGQRDTGGLFCAPPWALASSSLSHSPICKPLSGSLGDVGCSLQRDPDRC